MFSSWKIGRVAGIDLYLHPTLLLMIVLFGTTLPGMLLVAAVFGCVLLHELGHALMARHLGIGTADITLYPIGGVARLRRMPRKPGAELLIALAGPAVNVAIAGALGLALTVAGSVAPGALPASVTRFAGSLLAINLGLALFNLIPAFPMDGGRVLRALLGGWLGRLRATEIAARVGQALALLFGAYSLVSGAWLQVLLAAFVFWVAGRELASVRAEESLLSRASTQPRPEAILPEPPPGYVWIPRGGGQWRLAPIVLTVEPERGHASFSSWR
jgi:Zn-dependent protease